MTGYAWPGNVRELSAWVERLYVTGPLAGGALGDAPGRVECHSGRSIADGQMTLEQVERQAIVQAMEQANFNQRKAARMLRPPRHACAEAKVA